MTTRSRLTIALSTAVVVAVACSKNEAASKDTSAPAAAAAPTPAPPAAFSFADAAGKWQVRATPESGKDTTPTNYVLTATADTAGWMIEFPSGVKVPLHVMVSGDSLMVNTPSFASQRRKNVKVSTESVLRLQNGKLLGMSVAHYVNAGADSVLRLRTEGTKVP